jgi:CDP-4-dehydro-6-deoxyglucose reductase, E3
MMGRSSEAAFREVCIAATRPLSPNVAALELATADGSEIHWRSGQYVELLVPQGASEPPERWKGDRAWLEAARATRHPFSIASGPEVGAAGKVELAVGTGEGDSVSSLLKRLPPGVRLGMLGPMGDFTRAGRCDEPALFVAAGTGVAPLRAMILSELARSADGPPLALLFGARGEQDVLWYDEFRALEARHARFRYEPTLSRPGNGWAGRRGRVQEHISPLLDQLGQVPVFVAGQAEMVADVCRILEEELGHPPDRIRTERYG